MGGKVGVALALMLLTLFSSSSRVDSRIRHYKFTVVRKNTTRLCASKPIITVNGKFPGPTLYAREDDTVIIRVVNHVTDNVTIHWHGVRQLRTGWADGPAYITQCPIQTGQSYIYKFTLTGQRGTLLWHAHINWQRATVHGAIVILPRLGVPYPFPEPHKEEIIILGEWWKADVEAVINQAMQAGLPPNVSDAHTINGLPGPSPNCSYAGYSLHVESGKTYLLRIINAAVNEELFFKIAGHHLTVVEVDAAYTKPFKTDTVFIGPGQTTTALLAADRPAGNYIIAISPFMDTIVATDNQIATATLRYDGAAPSAAAAVAADVPARNATAVTAAFMDGLRSLSPAAAPSRPATSTTRSSSPSASASTRAVLQRERGVHGGLSAAPPAPYDYTGAAPANMRTTTGTRVYRVEYNATVQIVLQGTAMIAPESHPTHLHGFNFYAVGRGVGNYDPINDPKRFNLDDPVERNTISVPTGGWTAIRFRADNPGMWFLHCHLEVHTTWGLKMAFLVENGKGPNQSILPPPKDLPKC
uniref:laccase n=1 Tax=Salvia miltiorrhiza TaxID=226208 RepID=A0A4Y5RSX9_SALMI|nr:laccase 25 [Salvia miltiorrhiza]